jgi:hypothetical protein
LRKEIDVTIEAEGRDKGKVFHIREMPASKAEKWAMRAIMMAARSGLDTGQTLAMGMQGIAMIGISALMTAHFDEAEPLLDEMMESITPKVIAGQAIAAERPLIEDDIDEVGTRLQLRSKWLELHLGFSLAGAPSTSTSATPATK